MEMRGIFTAALEKAMQADERLVVIDADLARANGTIGLRQKCPERAFDVGIAEQNMAGVAAGIASQGFIPFIGSFAPFVSRRICDQVAISIAYARLPVKLVGSDPGLTAELNGGTHMGIEDIGVLRSISTMIIVEPCDGIEMEQAVPEIIAHQGPVYLRMHRKEVTDLHDDSYQFDLFRADVMRRGDDITIVASGALMVHQAFDAVDLLEKEGIHAELINMHTVKPIDDETLITSVRKTGAVVTAENHNIIGGLASAVSEVLVRRYPAPLRSVGIQDRFGEVGKLPGLLEAFHMSSNDIAREAKKLIKEK
jgi:transketolase